MLDDRGVRDGGVGAADVLRNVWMRLGQTLDVGLVDDRVGVLVAGRAIDAPVEVRVDHHRLGHAGGGVVVVAAVGIAEVVAEHRLIPFDRPIDRLRVGIEDELGRVASVPGGRVVRPVHPVAVALSRLDVGDEAVPDEPVDLGQRQPGLAAVGVEQAQLNRLARPR